MMRRLAIVMLVSLFMPMAGTTGQENASSDLTEKLQALQGQFDQWQQNLAGMHFEELTPDKHWLFFFNQERAICLETMKAANEQITAAEVEKGEGPRLAQEFLLFDDLDRLSDHLNDLLHFVIFSFEVAPPASTAGPASVKWQRELVSLGSMVKAVQPLRGILRSDVYNRLDSIGQAEPTAAVRIPPSPAIKPEAPGQISGHIYRTDTGAPLPNAIVTLIASPSGNTRLQRSAADGSYRFPAVTPRVYWLAAYRTGFVGEVSGNSGPQTLGTCPPSCISLSGGQKFNGIDLRLGAEPSITAMAEDGFATVYPEKPLHLTFGPARFSPDGKFLAITVGGEATEGRARLWLYDMHSHRLTPVTEGLHGTPLDYGIHDWAWTTDDTLYLGGLFNRHRVGHQAYVAVTMTGIAKEIAAVPRQIAATFQEDEALQSSGGIDEETHNAQYIVTSQRVCRGCSYTLTARRRNGGAARLIAKIDRNFILDPDRSLVFYPKLRFFDGSIVIFDLKTWQPQEIPLPVMAQTLLDQTRISTGHLVAYLVAGSCEPDASSEEAESQRMASVDIRLRQETQPWHVCFVRLP